MMRTLLALLLMAVFSAHAGELRPFLEVGISDYEKPPCSLWHHDCGGYPTEFDTRPAMFRVGVEFDLGLYSISDQDGFNLWYADLGNYGISALACDDEGFVLAGGGRNCPVNTHWYYVTGSMRALGASYRYRWPVFGGRVFVENGVGKFRQAFKLEKDDGVRHSERLWGTGYVLGVGYEFKNDVSLGYFVYSTKVGGNFADGQFPSGTGSVGALVLRVQF